MGELTASVLVQQTGFAVHALPLPMPMAVIGEQVKPRSPVRSPRTMPSNPARVLAAVDELCHCVSPLEREPCGL